jgi:hypothetical protein
MKPLSSEPSDRERFLAAVAEQVAVDRVVELYLFQPIRQGGVESGVAVIAATGDAPVAQPEPARADRTESLEPELDISSGDVDRLPNDGVAKEQQVTDADDVEQRYTVFTARYRHVLKGPERGRWEVSVVAEGDAPLATVGAVVRGVQRRAGDVDPPEHMTGDALRDALTGGPAAQP